MSPTITARMCWARLIGVASLGWAGWRSTRPGRCQRTWSARPAARRATSWRRCRVQTQRSQGGLGSVQVLPGGGARLPGRHVAGPAGGRPGSRPGRGGVEVEDVAAGHQEPSWWQTGQRRRAARRSQRAWVRALVELPAAGRAGGDPDAAQQVQGRLGMRSGRVGLRVHPRTSSRARGARGRDGSLRPGLTAARAQNGGLVVELPPLPLLPLAARSGLAVAQRRRGGDLVGLDLDHRALVALGGLPGRGT